MIRVLLVDDSPDFLNAITEFLTLFSDITVVGQALSGPEALDLDDDLHPDLVLIDLVMSGMNGLEATRLLCQRALAPRVVIVTSYDDLEYRVAAVAVGASGYLVKPDLAQTLLPLLHSLFPSRVMAVSVA